MSIRPAVRWRPGVTSSYQEPPRTSPGGDPRRVPERGAGAPPAPPADLVVHPRGLLAVRMSLDVGVKPEPAPQWLPSHEPTLGVARFRREGAYGPARQALAADSGRLLGTPALEPLAGRGG